MPRKKNKETLTLNELMELRFKTTKEYIENYDNLTQQESDYYKNKIYDYTTRISKLIKEVVDCGKTRKNWT